MTNKIYIPTALKEEAAVSVFGKEITLALNWADGMIGVFCVFDSLEAAEKYANGKYTILIGEGGVSKK